VTLGIFPHRSLDTGVGEGGLRAWEWLGLVSAPGRASYTDCRGGWPELG